MNSFAASELALEFAIVLKLKNNKKNIPAGKCDGCKWIHPKNVAWLVSLIPIWFFVFSFFTTTSLQLGVSSLEQNYEVTYHTITSLLVVFGLSTPST